MRCDPCPEGSPVTRVMKTQAQIHLRKGTLSIKPTFGFDLWMRLMSRTESSANPSTFSISSASSYTKITTLSRLSRRRECQFLSLPWVPTITCGEVCIQAIQEARVGKKKSKHSAASNQGYFWPQVVACVCQTSVWKFGIRKHRTPYKMI